MTLEPIAFESHRLTVEAELAPNVNVHGTAFAGSLYAIAALSGWGLVHLELARAGAALRSETGRTRFELTARIDGDDGEAVVLEANYAVKRMDGHGSK